MSRAGLIAVKGTENTQFIDRAFASIDQNASTSVVWRPDGDSGLSGVRSLSGRKWVFDPRSRSVGPRTLLKPCFSDQLDGLRFWLFD